MPIKYYCIIIIMLLVMKKITTKMKIRCPLHVKFDWNVMVSPVENHLRDLENIQLLLITL